MCDASAIGHAIAVYRPMRLACGHLVRADRDDSAAQGRAPERPARRGEGALQWPHRPFSASSGFDGPIPTTVCMLTVVGFCGIIASAALAVPILESDSQILPVYKAFTNSK